MAILVGKCPDPEYYKHPLESYGESDILQNTIITIQGVCDAFYELVFYHNRTGKSLHAAGNLLDFLLKTKCCQPSFIETIPVLLIPVERRMAFNLLTWGWALVMPRARFQFQAFSHNQEKRPFSTGPKTPTR